MGTASIIRLHPAPPPTVPAARTRLRDAVAGLTYAATAHDDPDAWETARRCIAATMPGQVPS